MIPSWNEVILNATWTTIAKSLTGFQLSPKATISEQTNYAIRHGFDPIPRPHPNIPLTPGELRLIEIHKTYQWAKLRGFIIQELQDIRCWDKVDAKATDIDSRIPIHPTYHASRWRKTTMTIGNRHSELWNMIEPLLKTRLRAMFEIGILVAWLRWDISLVDGPAGSYKVNTRLESEYH